MSPDEMEAPRAFERLSRQQLETYARELREHFQEELRLRKEMEALNWRMTQQLQELTALNRLFRRHLSERFAVVDAHRQVLRDLTRVAQKTAALAKRAEARLPPDLQGARGPGSENDDSRVE
ncbi:MAG: hypothetical protein HW388_425 [Dehalococcoidia bacterium]|nr:hypothetical protein [Dehalococcoidia bacterium]